MTAGGRAHLVRRLLAESGFRRLLALRFVGQVGDGLLQGALFGAAFFNPDQATSATGVAVAFAVVLLPYSAVGPFAGVLLDRASRQRVLLLTNLVRGAVVLALASAVSRGGATSVATVALALVAVSLNRFVLSGLSAALPHVVPAATLVTANSLSTTLGTAAATAGGFASLGLRRLWGSDDAGAGAIAVVAAVVYLVAAGLATRIARDQLGPSGAVTRQPLVHALQTAATGFAEGLRHLRRRPAAAQALLAVTAHRFVSGLLFVIVLLVYTRDGYLHGDLTQLGLTVSAAVAGGVAAAVVTPRISRAIGTQRWIVVSLGLAALSAAALFPPYRPWSLTTGAVALGFTGQAVKICVDTLVQQSVDDDFRGRVFACYDVLFNVSFVAAAGCAALVVPDDGHSDLVVGLAAVGYLATSAAYAVGAVRATVTGRAAPAASARR